MKEDTVHRIQTQKDCSNAEKLLKYDRKQFILSHMYSPSEIFLNVVVVR
jgi:hypothetical protein